MTRKSVNRKIKSEQFRHLAESFGTWLETLGYKPHTVNMYHSNAREFFAFLETDGTLRLKDFKNGQTAGYLEHLQHRPNYMRGGSLSPGHINKHVTALRLLGKYLQLSGKANTVIRPELFKTTETATCLSRAEVQALYGAARDEANLYNQRDTAMLGIYYGCGLRASEGAALNIKDLLFEKGLLYVRKGKGYKERYVPMNKQVKADLREYIFYQRNDLLNNKGAGSPDGPEQALLLGRPGHRWSVSAMYSRLELLKNRTADEGLKQKTFGLHILRHSIATHLLQSGMKLEHISRFLGHKSLETTQKYTHLAKDDEL